MRTRVAVDLTEHLAAGANREVVAFTRILLERLKAAAADDLDLLLVTLPGRQPAVVLRRPPAPPAWIQRLRDRVPLRTHLRKMLAAATPARDAVRVERTVRPWRRGLPRLEALREQRAEVVLCPYTAPGFYETGIPLVSLVHGMPFEAYPEFFSPQELETLRRGFADAYELAARLVCSSAYVRRAVLDATNLPEERVVTISPRLELQPEPPAPDPSPRTLASLGLRNGAFLLYSADFLPIKNHSMLFTAFGMFRARQPESPLKLVCVGESDVTVAPLREAVARMRLEGWIVLRSNAGPDELNVLLKNCAAVVYPSLYEGSGLAILHAMQLGKPVLCSNTTALPEVAQDAAVYFDPRRPDEIVRAIEVAAAGGPPVTSLVARGHRRVAALMQRPEQMAEEYVALLKEVAGSFATLASV